MVSKLKSIHRNMILRLLRYSNTVAVMMILLAFYVCFSENNWLYVAILGVTSSYLAWLTCQYVYVDSTTCEHPCKFQYGCQIESFHNRLSIVSNITISLIGMVVTGVILKYLLGDINPIGDGSMRSIEYVLHTTYIVGLFKMLLIYMIADKIHMSQLLMSVLYRYRQSVRFLSINLDKNNPEKIYPIIFLDGSVISPIRYRVSTMGSKVVAIFEPPLSLGENSRIEYSLVKEDDCTHIVFDDPSIINDDDFKFFSRCNITVEDVNRTNQYTDNSTCGKL